MIRKNGNGLGKNYLTNNNLIIGKYLYDNNFSNLDAYSSQVLIHNKIYNFLEITPSIGYDFPIFKDSYGFHLSTEIFYSYKKISQKNKSEFIDNIYQYANEFGFQIGISRLN